MGIEDLRAKIDEIDKEVVELFNKRMQVSAEIAKDKKETGKAVFDPARERELLAKVAEVVDKLHREVATNTAVPRILCKSRAR